MQRRDLNVIKSLGNPLTQRVKESRVLLVGAGGIGCELLKNLVCCGFGTASESTQEQQIRGAGEETSNGAEKPPLRAEIVVVDLDTIDLSNLNRQFLFRKHHIKKPKALVAKETASRFNPSAKIDAQHASIFDKKYNVSFFEQFDLVFNALDNLAARRHVNRMCLAANVPLGESGTTGFNGQVQVIQKGVTECYDCNPKPVQKSFPICTIRSTPSQPIHCIVWAKSYLFPELFGSSDEDESHDVAVTDSDNATEVAKLQEEAEALKKIKASMGTSTFVEDVFNKVFHHDVERLRSMSEMWQSRKPPISLGFEKSRAHEDLVRRGRELAEQDQAVWNLRDNTAVFCYSLDVLGQRVKAGEQVIEFDKDDKDTLDFVTSAANLRSQNFGIAPRSEWDIKQMAGNIIPAIATSNALTASLCVLQAFKVLRANISSINSTTHRVSTEQLSTKLSYATVNGQPPPTLGGAKMVFLNSRNTERMILSQGLVPPNLHCPVCSPVYAKLTMPVNTDFTLQDLVNLVQKDLSYGEFSITTDAGVIFDPDLDDNLGKSLATLGIEIDGTGFVTITDDSDEPRVNLVLSVTSPKIESNPSSTQPAAQLQLLPSHLDVPQKPVKVPEVNGHEVPETINKIESSSSKRKREPDEDFDVAKKKTKSRVDEEVVLVEDDGAIILDD